MSVCRCHRGSTRFGGGRQPRQGLHLRTKHGLLFGMRKGIAEAPATISVNGQANLWAAATSITRLICKLVHRAQGELQIQQAIKWLRENLIRRLEEVWIPEKRKEWVQGPRHPGRQHNDDTDDGHTIWTEVQPSEHELALWRVGAAHHHVLTGAQWGKLSAAATRMATASACKAKRRTHDNLKKWAQDCLEDHGIKGHAYCRGQTDVEDMYDAPAKLEQEVWKFAKPDDAVAARAGP